MKKTSRSPYYERESNGSIKIRFTMEEAKEIVKDCKLVQTATGYVGRRDNLVEIEKYDGRYGKGFSLHYGSFSRKKDSKTFHYVDYYIREEVTP